MAKILSYKTAALLVAISAALYLVSITFVGTAALTPLLVIALIAGFFAIGLYREWRWLAYFAFLALLISMLFTYPLSFGEGAIPSWVYTANTLVSLGAAIIVFVLLWRSKPVAK